MRPQRNRLILLAAATALIAVLGGCGPRQAGQSGAGAASGQALVGGPFQLVDQNGKPADQSLLQGRWSAVFFGYTYCPDVCPTTLQVLAQAKAMMGPKAADLQIVFVSIDPDRDTPAQMKTYLSTPAFPQPTIGLTGSAAQVAAVAKAYRVYYQKDGSGEGYSVAHSSIVYLMNPKGVFDRVLSESQTPSEIATQIGEAMKAGPKAAA